MGKLSADFKVTPAHRKMIRKYVETGNKSEAGRHAGFTPSYARELFSHPAIIDVLNECQKKAGLTDELLLGAHVELLNQTEDKSVRLQAVRLGYQVNKKIGGDDSIPPGAPPAVIIIREPNGKADGKQRGIRVDTSPGLSVRRADKSK